MIDNETKVFGDRASFALELGIARTYPDSSSRALGHVVIWLNGQPFGVQENDASMLACSLDQIRRRYNRRGLHIAPSLAEMKASQVMKAYLAATYWAELDHSLQAEECSLITDAITKADGLWAPDGDEAFDDGSHVLHFDCGEVVRLIGAKNTGATAFNDVEVVETFFDANRFYAVLLAWMEAFRSRTEETGSR